MKAFFKRAGSHAVALSAMLSILACNYLYKLTNGLERPLHSMELGIDRLIPFREIFIIPYIIWGPFIFISLIYLAFKNRDSYYRMIVSSVIGHLVSYVIYMTYQTTVPRPVITGDTFLLKLVSYVYANDEPVNCFPSIHVLTTYLIMRAFLMEKLPRYIAWIPQTIGILIILSTLFVRQHVIADVIGAILLAEVLLVLVYQPSAVRAFFASFARRAAVRTERL